MAMTVAHGRVLLSSSYCLKGYMKRAEAQPLSNPRCLRRFMISHMDIDMIKEEKAMLPGGDLRLKGNAWLRAAWTEAKISRVPREAEFRKIVSNLASHYKFCSPADVVVFFATHLRQKYDIISGLNNI